MKVQKLLLSDDGESILELNKYRIPERLKIRKSKSNLYWTW